MMKKNMMKIIFMSIILLGVFIISGNFNYLEATSNNNISGDIGAFGEFNPANPYVEDIVEIPLIKRQINTIIQIAFLLIKLALPGVIISYVVLKYKKLKSKKKLMCFLLISASLILGVNIYYFIRFLLFYQIF